MEWLSYWWHDDILKAGKGPLVLGFAAFVVTFLTTRTITRLIRAGRGPFHDLSNGSTHLHHSTPGTVLLITGAFTSVGADGRDPWNAIAALLIGVGASLVLDEFAMIFHLQDVYWTQEGQLSVSVVCLAAATLGLAILGLTPGDLARLDSTSGALRSVLAALVACHFVFVVACAAKGKYPMALMGLFFAPFAWVGADAWRAPHRSGLADCTRCIGGKRRRSELHASTLAGGQCVNGWTTSSAEPRRGRRHCMGPWQRMSRSEGRTAYLRRGRIR